MNDSILRWAPLLAAALSVAVGCAQNGEVGIHPAGGDTSVSDRSSHAYGFPASNLSDVELARHLEGDVLFEAVFVTAPAPVNPGLGPLFNNTACSKCHVRDGRGLASVGEPGGSQLRVTVSSTFAGQPWLPTGPILVPRLGIQLQDHAVYGYLPEANVSIEWYETAGVYGDGEPFSLRWPALQISASDGEPLPGWILTSPRIPPPVFGLGLLEAVPECEILGRVDPTDTDGDGISGRANTVWDLERSATRLGRFGWKATMPTVLQASAADFSEDMGVSSPLFPDDDGSSDVDTETLRAVTFYVQTLAVPDRTGAARPDVQQGEQIFRDIGCGDCHVETLHTGDHPIPALRDQIIHPYTDMLLHDMGHGLADWRHDFDAWDTEWRTSPLWGIGLSETVLPYSTFLHDGRARSIEEAILWHGGEAEAPAEAFRTLPAIDRSALVAFLGSL